MNASEIERRRRMVMHDLRAMQEKPAVTPGTWIWRYDDSKYKYWSLARGSFVTTIDEASKYDSLESAIDSYRFDHRLAPGMSFARIEQDAAGEWREVEVRRLESAWAATCSRCGEMCRDSVARDEKRVCVHCIGSDLTAALRRAEEAEAIANLAMAEGLRAAEEARAAVVVVDVDALGDVSDCTPPPVDQHTTGSYRLLRFAIERGKSIRMALSRCRDIKITVGPSAGGHPIIGGSDA